MRSGGGGGLNERKTSTTKYWEISIFVSKHFNKTITYTSSINVYSLSMESMVPVLVRSFGHTSSNSEIEMGQKSISNENKITKPLSLSLFIPPCKLFAAHSVCTRLVRLLADGVFEFQHACVCVCVSALFV